MQELIRTNNAVLITAVEALLQAADISYLVLDQHMSVLEGSLGILPRRVLVETESFEAARDLLEDAGLGQELRPDRLRPDTAATGHAADTSQDAALGGRLRLRQRRHGHRFGHDAILLAAAVDARAGDRAADFGAGVGTAGLALAVRCPDVEVALIEIDPDLSDLAAGNIADNGLDDRVRAVTLDLGGAAGVFTEQGLDAGSLDHVLMNPPFNDANSHRASPDADRRSAHVAAADTLSLWIAAGSRLLHGAGTLTLIWRASGLGEVLSALPAAFGEIAILPVHGRADRAAIRVIVRARKGRKAPLTLLPGLALNDGSGQPTAEAEAVMRHAQALPMADG